MWLQCAFIQANSLKAKEEHPKAFSKPVIFVHHPDPDQTAGKGKDQILPDDPTEWIQSKYTEDEMVAVIREICLAIGQEAARRKME